jgi:hypothetical protein
MKQGTGIKQILPGMVKHTKLLHYECIRASLNKAVDQLKSMDHQLDNNAREH